MRKLLVYFHDKGGHKDNQNELLAKLSQKLDADIFVFNAPHVYKKGYMWFGKDEDGRVILDDFNQSISYAFEKIEKEVCLRNLTFKDVIFAGNSQGGFMALNSGFMLGANMVITLCSDIPTDFDYLEGINIDFPIFWIEGGNDTFLTQVRKDTYKKLEEYGCNFKRIINEKSAHNVLDISIVDEIN